MISGVSELSWHLWSWRSAKIIQVENLSFEGFCFFTHCEWGSNDEFPHCPGVTWKSWKILTWVKESQDISPCYLRWTKIHNHEGMNQHSLEPFSIISPSRMWFYTISTFANVYLIGSSWAVSWHIFPWRRVSYLFVIIGKVGQIFPISSALTRK